MTHLHNYSFSLRQVDSVHRYFLVFLARPFPINLDSFQSKNHQKVAFLFMRFFKQISFTSVKWLTLPAFVYVWEISDSVRIRFLSLSNPVTGHPLFL